MYRLFFTPTWFNGWDIAFDVISLLVALLIAGFSWRMYKLHKGNKFFYFSLSFILVALGFASKAFTNGILYFTPIRDVAATVLAPTLPGQGLDFSFLYYRAAFFVQMVLMLGAWLLLFFVSQKSRARLTKFYEVSQIGLFVYFVLLISVVSNFQYTVFYLTSSVILSLIVLNYYKAYLTNKNKNTKSIMWSFLLILLGNLAFIFVFWFTELYVIGEILQLLGFLVLLGAYMRVRR